MQNSLSATTGAGTQTNTQNPQSATSDNNLISGQSNLQSSSVNLFNGTSGVSLKPASLSSVNLQARQSTSTNQPVQPIKHHHINGVLLGIVIVVFVAALIIFWQTTLVAKSTTE